ncbi:hypothetical protein QBC37DRAFT_445978 [Rhypophila decipiens]|uniref:Uncharacterized protein n=1 Tax=Rhypophila decipiens TaxID=261697 RepID=A0AAN6Y3M7_9PEZI|nr:hypothetical protein QBC37DRAFT_445978 [Rhypophila decipiens]
MSESRTWKCFVLRHSLLRRRAKGVLEAEDTIYFRFGKHTADPQTCQCQQRSHQDQPDQPDSPFTGLGDVHPLVWLFLIPLFLSLARTIMMLFCSILFALLAVVLSLLLPGGPFTRYPTEWHSGVAAEYSKLWPDKTHGRHGVLQELNRLDDGHLILRLKKAPAKLERIQRNKNMDLREGLQKRIDVALKAYVLMKITGTLAHFTRGQQIPEAEDREEDLLRGHDSSEYLTYFSDVEPGHESEERRYHTFGEHLRQEVGRKEAEVACEKANESLEEEDQDWQEVSANDEESHDCEYPSERGEGSIASGNDSDAFDTDAGDYDDCEYPSEKEQESGNSSSDSDGFEADEEYYFQ